MDYDEYKDLTPDERRERREKLDDPFDPEPDPEPLKDTVFHVCPHGNAGCGQPKYCDSCLGRGPDTDFDPRER